MEIDYVREFRERYSELPEKIKLKAEKQENIFRSNPLHPSLHTEKLSPKSKEVWSFRVDKNYRVIFKFSGKNRVIFLSVGHHHWIYRAHF